MKFWLDVKDASGNKIGPGPVHTITQWTHTRRISRAGNISFALPATDERWTLPNLKTRVHCMVYVAQKVTEVGAGIVDQWNGTLPAGGDVNLQVNGDDQLRELTYRTVGSLRVAASDTAIVPAAAVHHDPSTQSDADLIADSPITLAADEYIYVGDYDQFEAFTVALSVYNVNGATLSAQYFDQGGTGYWEDLSISDGTNVTGTTFAQDGTITWTKPDSWIQMRHNGRELYWVRFRVNTPTSPMTFTHVYITTDGRTDTGPQDIMAFAPSGWSLDTVTGHDVTELPIRWQFDGETVLAALVKLADLTGESFHLGEGRTVVWMQMDTPASGIRAVMATDPNAIVDDDICIITSLRRNMDTYNSFIGRIYCRGKDETITLEGYEIPGVFTAFTVGTDAKGSYLEHTTTWSVYGIEMWAEYKDAKTPDELFQEAVAELKMRNVAYDAYSLTVEHLNRIIYPGETIFVDFRRVVDGYVMASLKTDLIVLESTTRIDGARGVQTVTLQLANVPRYPDSEAEALARLL
ncbi:MAG: hypothetical protein IAE79_02630 [Anaerolinea sp.]|nr:hypothetical protein [Anaerolinea sp.]